MPQVNWDSASELPAEGKYLTEIENAMLNIGQKSGHEYFRLSLKLIDTGDKASDIMSFSPRAMGITRRKLRALGLEHIQDVTEDDLIGKRILAHIKHEEGMDGEAALSVDIGQGQAGYEPVSDHVQKQPETTATASTDFDDDIPF